MIELMFAVLFGVLFGIITGLIPGVHVNTISLFVLSYIGWFLNYFSLLSVVCLIISMAVTHTFLNAIPTIYLGAPDSDSFLGVLPGHRYLLKGWGYMALKLTLIGSLFGLLLSIVLMPVIALFLRLIFDFIKSYIVYFLIFIVCFMIYRDHKKFWSIIVFVMSASLGWMVLNTYNLQQPLFPMLTGLFGFSTLIYSLRTTSVIPEQLIISKIKLKGKIVFRAVLASTLAGFITSMLPGIGSSQGALVAKQFAGEVGDHGFMVLLGGVNTVNFVLSLVTFFVLFKARNGAIVTVMQLIGEISLNQIFIFVLVTLIVGVLVTPLTLFIGRIVSKSIDKINYKLLVWVVVGFIIILTPLISGWIGVLILFTSTMLGLIPAIVKCSRTHAMGCLLFPVIVMLL